MNKLLKYTLIIVLFSYITPTLALQLPLPKQQNSLVGKITSVTVKPKETMTSIARRFDLGFFELVEANPQVNPQHLQPGATLIIPAQFVLPQVPRRGIVINLAAMRVYFFPKNKNYFYTYPVGIGKQDWSTPLGSLHIIQKTKNPTWFVPKSIYEFRKKEGDPISHKVLSGPDNPLGYYAMRLSKPTYLIHGTNDPASVGVRSSAGCIHLYPEDIKALFNMVKIKEPVLIINQPYFVGWSSDTLYMEAHYPLAEDRATLSNASADSVALVNSQIRSHLKINWKSARETINDHSGVPTPVAHISK